MASSRAHQQHHQQQQHNVGSSTNMPVTQLYRRDEVIGRGNFGVVYKGVNRETKQVVAIKVLNLDTIEDDLIDIQQEISTLSQLSMSDAANITKYYGSYLHGTKLWIIMDLCAGGSVRTLLKAGKFDERHIAVVTREVCVALAYIHKEGIIHRDIKAANILITNTGSVRLCDFGVAAKVTANKLKRSTIVGTPYWMAPEVITEGALYNTKADIWSLGVTVYEIATGNPPFADQEALRVIMLIPKQKPARLEGSQYSPGLKEFVAHCLDEHSDERPSAEELLKMKFVKNSRSNPTSCLREVVQRYMTWRQTNNVRDSIAMLKGIKEGDDYDDEDVDYNSDSESVWDFDTSDVTTFDYGAMTPIRKGSPTNEIDKLNGLGFTYPAGFSASQESTMRAPPPPALEPGAPQSLLELFEEEYSPGKASAPILSPAMDQFPTGSNHLAATATTQPSTPTIEIPEFDSLETETINSVQQQLHHNQVPQPPPFHRAVSAAPTMSHPLPQAIHQPPQPTPSAPPTIPPQSAQRSRSSTLSNTITPQSLQQQHLHQHSTQNSQTTQSSQASTTTTQSQQASLPPVPTIPAAANSSSSAPASGQGSPTSSATPGTTQMLPPALPHNNSRRTPSPIRMAPKASSSNSSNNSSPPKSASTTMKPIVRSKLHNETLHSTTSEEESNTASKSPPIDTGAATKRKPLRPGMHIAMPPPSLPFQPPQLSAAAHDEHHHQDDQLSFPQLPKLDTSVLLDSTQKQDVISHLDQMLEGFSVGLAAVEEGLYNLVM